MRRTIYIEPQCPVGSYEEDLSTGESACVPCPTNSFSTMEGSREYSCFEGYFRTVLTILAHVRFIVVTVKV